MPVDPSAPTVAPSERSRIRRAPKRASYDTDTIHSILDAALVCHVAFVDDGQPFCIPTLHARVGTEVFVHGATSSRMIKTLSAGASACLTVTMLDGLVLARSAFHHSMNYRSVALLGAFRLIADEHSKLDALRAFTEQLVPGRWADVRAPSAKELKATTVLALSLDEASAKVRTGPPVDDEPDYERPTWAGVVPLTLERGTPQPDARVPSNVALPPYLAARANEISVTTEAARSVSKPTWCDVQ